MPPLLAAHMQGFAVDVARLFIWLVLLSVVFVPLERLFALHQAPAPSKRVLTDIAYFFLNSLAPAMVIALMMSLLLAPLGRLAPQPYIGWVGSLPLWATLSLGVLVSEVGTYWGHRWSHEIPFLWRFHALHHSAEHIDWLINTRAHPVDLIFIRLCGLAPLYLLGLAHPSATGQAAMVPVYVTLVGTVWAFFIHANLRWRFGPLEWLISTPAFHHWHHTNDGYRDRNYAALLPWIDRVFRTHHLPDHWPPCYGVDKPSPATFAGQLLEPFDHPRRG